MGKKICSVEEAVSRIKDGATVSPGGTGVVLEPDLVLEALEKRFLTEGHPCNLTLFSPLCTGDRPNKGGLNCFAHEGMTKKVITSVLNPDRHPRLCEMVQNGVCEGYELSMGTMMQLLTSIASRKPGLFTTVGIGSFLDPRVEGGCMNQRSKNPPVRLEQIDGKEYLFHPSLPIDVAIIRGTTSDENGYISFEEEPNILCMLELAAAARASGGIVIAQVKRVVKAGSLDPRMVRIPGPLVDVIVVHPQQTQLSPQMADPLNGWNPFITGALKASLDNLPRLKDTIDRAVLRRAVLELRSDDVINLGAGMATHLPRIALEEGILEKVVFTNEHGIFGGMMATPIGLGFVTALNPEAIMDSSFQFGFYEGGGLDITFLGFGEVDADGNINVGKFSGKLKGPGGFNTICENTPRLVFCGTLTSGGLKVEVSGGRMNIIKEGRFRKFLPKIEQITFNAKRAYKKGQSVLYITERAVFRIADAGFELIEVAPGIDVERDIRQQVGFPLRVSESLKTMDPRILGNSELGIASKFQ